MNDLISVIIPIYKVEKYLDACIESVVNQSYKKLEIILVDDGSPDSCPQKCDEWAKKDKRIRVIHKENGGLSDARNIGIDNSKGDYILFVDSDDFIPLYSIYDMYKSMYESDADICEGDMKIINNHELQKDQHKEYIIKEYKKEDAMENMMYLNDFKNSAWSKLYKREVIGNIRFPKGKIYEDLATTYKFFEKANKVIKINTIVYYYFQNIEGITHNKYSSKRLLAIDFAEEELSFCEKKYKSIIPAAYYRIGYECIRVLNDMPYFCKDTKKVYTILRKYRKEVLKDKKVSLKKKLVFYSSYFGKFGIKLVFLIK